MNIFLSTNYNTHNVVDVFDRGFRSALARMRLCSTTPLLALMLQSWKYAETERLEYIVTKTVEAEQYRYVQIESEGDFRVELRSLEGDADLYVSDETDSPSYADYKLKSTSCGDDLVLISHDFSRPVYVGVYGYFAFEQSRFELQVFSVDRERDLFAENSSSYEYAEEANESSEKRNAKERSKKTANRPNVPKGEEEESLLWSIFVGILKIILDILV